MISSYDDLNVGLFFDIKEILETDLELLDKEVALIAMLDNRTQDEVLSMGVNEFSERVKGLQFLTQQPRQIVPDTKYVIDGMVFSVMMNIADMNVAQYIDYNAYIQMEDERDRLIGLLSVFMIPKGKKYGEYDIEDVKKKLNKMTVTNVMSLSAFFLEWSKALTKATHTYLIKKMKKMIKREKNTEIKTQMMEVLARLEDSGRLLQ